MSPILILKSGFPKKINQSIFISEVVLGMCAEKKDLFLGCVHESSIGCFPGEIDQCLALLLLLLLLLSFSSKLSYGGGQAACEKWADCCALKYHNSEDNSEKCRGGSCVSKKM